MYLRQQAELILMNFSGNLIGAAAEEDGRKKDVPELSTEVNS
jgi:hypothetical protein